MKTLYNALSIPTNSRLTKNSSISALKGFTMKDLKQTVLGTTVRGRTFRAAALCAIIALTTFGVVALMMPTAAPQNLGGNAQKAAQNPNISSALALESEEQSVQLDVNETKEASAGDESEDVSNTADDNSNTDQGSQAAGAANADAASSKPTETNASHQPAGQQSASSPSAESAPSHVHNWIDKTETIHHDAVYETVWHEPVYETRTTYHDVCVQCGAILDGGLAGQHLKNGSCTNYRTGVPFTEQVLVSEGYSEQVLVQAAWDETVVTGKYCSCGANV